MKLHLICLLLFITVAGRMRAQNALHMDLLARYDNDSLNVVDGDQVWNDLTGWADSSGHEYIIAGSTDSIYFFDITNPNTIILRDVEEGRSRNVINRDYATYQHYVYCVSDISSGSLQIFDLSYLPDSVHKVYDNDSLCLSAHTVFVDEANARMYLCKNQARHPQQKIYSTSIFSLANPEAPALIGEITRDPPFSNVIAHELYARGDIAYVSNGYDGIYFVNVADPAQPVFLGSITTYPGKYYNHSSWVDSTGKYIVFQDEAADGRPMFLYDISDFGNPKLKTWWNTHPGAVPHNGYWKGNFLYVSAYEDGVYLYDLSNPDSLDYPRIPRLFSFYDTYPANDSAGYIGFYGYHGYHGCWGVWPFLPSGNIIASDMSEGIFVIRYRYTLGTGESSSLAEKLTIYPNPSSSSFQIALQMNSGTGAHVEAYDMQGKRVYDAMHHFNPGQAAELSGSGDWLPGAYIVRVTTGSMVISQKVIRLQR
jgi:choice-of-anchor B domain-containing protein